MSKSESILKDISKVKEKENDELKSNKITVESKNNNELCKQVNGLFKKDESKQKQ